MTQTLSFGPTPQLGESGSSGTTAVIAGRLFSKIRQPDIIVVLAVCAIGLVLTLVAASTIPGFSNSLAEANTAVGP